jgi:hypothetical protein
VGNARAVLLVAAASLTAVHSSGQSTTGLSAPTLYISASGQYYTDSTKLDVKGASNLPPGSKLSVTLYDFIGYQSSILSEEAIVTLGRDGFFNVTLTPLPNRQFKPNMVCVIYFNPRFPKQDAPILKVVGATGELLGIDRNPQVGKNSGGYYLEDFVNIP